MALDIKLDGVAPREGILRSTGKRGPTTTSQRWYGGRATRTDARIVTQMCQHPHCFLVIVDVSALVCSSPSPGTGTGRCAPIPM